MFVFKNGKITNEDEADNKQQSSQSKQTGGYSFQNGKIVGGTNNSVQSTTSVRNATRSPNNPNRIIRNTSSIATKPTTSPVKPDAKALKNAYSDHAKAETYGDGTMTVADMRKRMSDLEGIDTMSFKQYKRNYYKNDPSGLVGENYEYVSSKDLLEKMKADQKEYADIKSWLDNHDTQKAYAENIGMGKYKNVNAWLAAEPENQYAQSWADYEKEQNEQKSAFDANMRKFGSYTSNGKTASDLVKDTELTIDSLQSEVYDAESAWRIASDSLAYFQSGGFDGNVTQSDIDNAKAKLDIASERLKTAKDNLKTAQQDLTFATSMESAQAQMSSEDIENGKRIAAGYARKYAQEYATTNDEFKGKIALDTTHRLYEVLKNKNVNDKTYVSPNEEWDESQLNYYYYLANDDPTMERANRYAETVNNALNKQKQMEKAEEKEDFAILHPVAGTAAGIVTPLVTGIPEYVGNVIEYQQRGTITTKENLSPIQATNYMVSAIANELNKQSGTIDDDAFMLGGKGAGDAYQLALSIAQSLLSVATGGEFGSLAMFFGSAASSGIYDALDKGVAPGKALAIGTMNGIAEVAGEIFSVENLLKMKASPSFKGILANILIQSGVEGSEEAFTTVLNTVSDIIVNGDENELAIAVSEYLSTGKYTQEEAEHLAIRDWLSGLAFDALGGALSGGISAGAKMGANYVAQNVSKVDASDARKLIEEAKGQGINVDSYQKTLDKTGTLSKWQMAQLGYNLNQQYATSDTEKIAEAATARLEELGESDAARKGQAIARDITGEFMEGDEYRYNPRTAAGDNANINQVKSELSVESVQKDIEAEMKAAYGTSQTANTETEVSARNAKQAKLNEDVRQTQQRNWVRNIGTDIVNAAYYNSSFGKSLYSKGSTVSIPGTNKTGKLTGIKVEDGDLKVIVRTEDGVQNYGLSDIKLDEQTQTFVKMLQNDLGEEGAAKAFAFYQNGQDIGQFVSTWATMQNLYGKGGLTLESAKASKLAKYISEDAVQAAWEAGVAVANRERLSRQYGFHGTGKVSYNGATLMDGTVLPEVSEERRKEIESEVKAISNIAKEVGVDVVLYDSASGLSEGERLTMANGMYTPGTVYLDINAGMDYAQTGKRMLLLTFSHELTHHIQRNSPMYDKLKQFVLENIVNKEGQSSLESYVGKQMTAYKGAQSLDLAIDDVVADACEEMLQSSKLMKKFASELTDVYGMSKEFADEFLSGMKFEGKSKESAAMRGVVEQLQQIWDDAMEDAAMAEHKTDSYTEVLNDDGEVVGIESEGQGQYSLRTYDEGGREKLTAFLDQRVKNGAITKEEKGEMLEQMEFLYDICQEYSRQYSLFGAWSQAEVVTDPETGKATFSVVKANGEYAMNLDFSLVCKKRRTLDAVFNQMIEEGIMDDYDMSPTSIAKINDIIRDHDFETACALCFVDAKRYRQALVSDSFVRMYNPLVMSMAKDGQGIDYFNFGGNSQIQNTGTGIDTLKDSELDFTEIDRVLRESKKGTVEYKIAKDLKEHPEDRKLLMRGDFMSTAGFDNINQNNKRVLGLYNSKKGAGGPKAAQSDVQYLSEILSSKKFSEGKAYLVGGVRIQSFSDYVPRLVFDYCQMIADLAAKKLPAHAYTKEPMFALQFGLTGIKVNMSLVPEVMEDGTAPGLDKDGNYAWRDGQSFGSTVYGGSKEFIQKCYEIIGKEYNGQDRLTAQEGYELAMAIQNATGYNMNCGTIAVGVSNEHIKKLLADPNIKMVIPYHKSSLNHIVAVMTNIDKYTDYTGVQNTRDANGVKLEKKKDTFNYNSVLQKLGDAKAAADEYLAWCDKNGYIPKFDDFRGEEGYYKLLEDFSCYDAENNAAMQGAVSLTLPSETDAFGSMQSLIRMGLEEDALLQAKQDKAIPEIINDIKGALPKNGSVATEVDTLSNEELRYKAREIERKDPRKVTEDDVLTLLYNVKNNDLLDHQLMPVRINTPAKFVEEVRNFGNPMENLPMAMSHYKANQAMSDGSIIFDDSTGHEYTPEQIIEIIRGMDDPVFIFYETEGFHAGHYVEVINFETDKFEKAFIAINPKQYIQDNNIEGYNGGNFNISITIYPGNVKREYLQMLKETGEDDAKIIKDLKNRSVSRLQNMRGVKKVYEKKGPLQGRPGGESPSLLNSEPFYVKSIPQGNTESQPQKSSRWQENEELSQAAMNHFGITENFYEAGYILPNGKMLDFSGRHWGKPEKDAKGHRDVDHQDIEELFDEIDWYVGADPRWTFISEGNIRFSPETPGINLSMYKEPTPQQYETIREFLKQHPADGFYVDIEGSPSKRLDSGEILRMYPLSNDYTGKVNPDRVINDIKAYYATGTVRQQSIVSLFHEQYQARSQWDDNTIREIEAAAEKRFGTTKDFDKAGYIMPNGKMLDFSPYKVPSFGNSMGHWNIDEILRPYVSDEEASDKWFDYTNAFLNRAGAIRMSKGGRYVQLPYNIEPTEAQYKTIEEYAKALNGNIRVNYNVIQQTKLYEFADPAQVVQDIRNHYAGKDNYESPLSEYRYQYQARRIYSQDEVNVLQSALNDSQKQMDKLQRLYEEISTQRDYWKHQTVLTDGKNVNVKAIDKYARELLKQQSSDANIDKLDEMLTSIASSLINATSDTFSPEDYNKTIQICFDAANLIIDNMYVVDEETEALQSAIKSSAKGGLFFLGESLLKEDFKSIDYSRKIFHFTRDRSKATNAIDTFYEELQNEWGLPDRSPIDAFEWMNDILNKDTKIKRRNMPDRESLASLIAADIMTDMEGKFVIEQTKADKLQAKNDKVAAKNAAKIAKLKQDITDLKERNKEQIESIKALDKDILLHDRANRKLETKIENMKASQERARERRNKALVRGKIKGLADSLNDRLLKPTESRHVPRELVKLTAEFLSSLDFSTNEHTAEKLSLIKAKYDALAKDETFASICYDDTVSDVLNKALESIGDTRVKDLSLDQLNDLYTAIKVLDKQIRDAVKVRINGVEHDAYMLADRMTNEVRRVPKPKASKWNRFNMPQMRPKTFFEFISDYQRDSAWIDMYNLLDEGQMKTTQIMMDGNKIFADLTNDAVGLASLSDTRKMVDVGLKDENGNAVLLTHGMLLSLYFHLTNADNTRHIAGGGITVPNQSDYYRGKHDDGFGTSVRVTGVSPKLAEMYRNVYQAETDEQRKAAQDKIADEYAAEDILIGELYGRVQEALSEYDRKWVAAGRQFFDVFTKNKINETTMEVYGIKKAEVEGYFPIHTDSDFRNANFDSIMRDGTLENIGMLKERVKSSNPIILEDFVDVINRQLSKTAQYCGLMPAIKTFNKVYSKTQTGYRDSLQRALTEKYEKAAKDYIENLLTDLNGARVKAKDILNLGKTLSKLRGNVAAATLTVNPRVALAQAASYPTAAAVIGWKPLAKALRHGGKDNKLISKADFELIAKYSPLLWYRSQGYSTVELGDVKNSRTVFKQLATKMEQTGNVGAGAVKAVQWFSNWIEAADIATVGRLWYACEYYVEDNFKDLQRGTDEFYMKTAEYFNKVVEETQPNYTTLQRTDVSRNPSELVKSIAMFTTQRFQNLNIMYSAWGKYQRTIADFGNGIGTKEDVAVAKENLGYAIGSQVVANAVMCVMKIMVDLLKRKRVNYSDDDDDLDAEKIAGEFGWMMVDSIVSCYLFGSEIVSLVKSIITKQTYYGLSLTGVDSVADTIDSIAKMAKDITNPKKWYKVMTNLCVNLGVPLNNVSSLVEAASGWANEISQNLAMKELMLEDIPDVDDITETDTTISRKQVKQRFTSGELTTDEAVSMLVAHAGMKEDKAYKTVFGWQYPDTEIKDNLMDDYLKHMTDTSISPEEYQAYRTEADTNGNGSLTQDETGALLSTLVSSGEITTDEADSFWESVGTSWTKSFEDWLNKKK